MKKITIYILLLAIPAVSFSQSTPGNAPTIKTDYLKKSHSQKTAAWILLGGGFALSTAGIAVGVNEVSNELYNIFDPTPEKTSNVGGVLFFTGCASMLGSIPFFISSGKNKRKAVSASARLKMEKAPMIQQKSLVQNSYPAISLKISF